MREILKPSSSFDEMNGFVPETLARWGNYPHLETPRSVWLASLVRNVVAEAIINSNYWPHNHFRYQNIVDSSQFDIF